MTSTDAPLCIRLKELRTKRGVTLPNLHVSTGIALHHLSALEECRYDDLPAGAVRKTILKDYLRAIEAQDLLLESHPELLAPSSASLAPTRPLSRSLFSISPRGWILAGVAILITAYFGFEVQAMIGPPRLSLQFPPDNFTTHDQTIALTGTTSPESVVTVNGVTTPISGNGAFKEIIHLKEGVNDIMVNSVTKRGGEARIARKVFYSN